MNSFSPSLPLKELGFQRERKEVTMNKGVSSGECLPKFFKVYLPDESGDDLISSWLKLLDPFTGITHLFQQLCLPKSLPKTVIVRSIYGNVWKMAFRKRCGDIERFVMVNGWKRIVKDEDLKGGEFLEFEFDGSWLFNFCIYGHATCKRLKSSVQCKEIDQADGKDGSSSDVIIVLDDDDDADDDDDGDDGDANYDQDYGKEDKSSENIIALDDDDDDDDDINGVKDYNEEDTSNDDDADAENDDINDVQNYDEEDTSTEDIIVIEDDDDDQDYGDDDYADDENERMRGVEKEGKEKGSSGEHDRLYLDNHMNPFFRVNQNLQRNNNLHIPTEVITDYGLHFPKFINLIDPMEKKFGKLKRKVEGQTIKGFGSILKRNKVKLTDKVICELEKEMNGQVLKIKVHVIRG